MYKIKEICCTNMCPMLIFTQIKYLVKRSRRVCIDILVPSSSSELVCFVYLLPDAEEGGEDFSMCEQ